MAKAGYLDDVGFIIHDQDFPFLEKHRARRIAHVQDPSSIGSKRRSNSPIAEDVLQNNRMRAAEVRAHPHEFQGQVPDRLPTEIVRKLSVLQPRKAVIAIVVEWAGIAAAIALCEAVPNSILYLCAVLWIGARQHALTVLGHDVAHFRLFSDRRWNDGIGNLTTLWPTFLSAEGYRQFHGDHHRYIGTAKDGNRVIWATHTAEGNLTSEWTFPKTAAGLVFMIIRRAAIFTGVFWIL